MKKDTSIFRKASLAQIQSPEELNSYIQVTNVNVWVVLSGIILLLVGVMIWGVFGNITTTVKTPVVAAEGQCVFYVSAQEADRIREGMTVTVEGQEAVVTAFSRQPQQIGQEMDPYASFIGGFQQGDFCCTGTLDLKTEDGVYEGILILESIHPMQFVIH